MRLQDAQEHAPGFPWDTPLLVRVRPHDGDPGGDYLICRLCLAEFGLRGDMVAERALADHDAFERHLAEAHG